MIPSLVHHFVWSGISVLDMPIFSFKSRILPRNASTACSARVGVRRFCIHVYWHSQVIRPAKYLQTGQWIIQIASFRSGQWIKWFVSFPQTGHFRISSSLLPRASSGDLFLSRLFLPDHVQIHLAFFQG